MGQKTRLAALPLPLGNATRTATSRPIRQASARGHDKADRALNEYLERDLPANESIPAALRGAIASQIHLELAEDEMAPDAPGMLRFVLQQQDPREVRKHLTAAIKAYPLNQAAHVAFADWLESQIEDVTKTVKQREPLLKETAKVMSNWSRYLPNDVEPRLWLVDYLFEQELMDEAEPHVSWLAGTRLDDPRVRAMPWKWQLLEAMRLCRRKSSLHAVSVRLQEAEQLWPAWLSRDWLPYLKAAATLREGWRTLFKDEWQQLCETAGRERESLADACMMLGAAQQMRVPATDLKTLRSLVDSHMKNLDKAGDDELLSVCGFFRDLHRARLIYPAYRMHGGKIVKSLFARFKKDPQRVLSRLDDERIHAAVFLFSEHQCLNDGYNVTLPAWYGDSRVEQHPVFQAVRLHAALKVRSVWRRLEDFAELGRQVREMAPSCENAYDRYWFGALADELDELVSTQRKQSAYDVDSLAGLFGFGDMADDEFRMGNGRFDPDPNCDCESCTAARRAQDRRQGR